jgi:hypothetical protein
MRAMDGFASWATAIATLLFCGSCATNEEVGAVQSATRSSASAADERDLLARFEGLTAADLAAASTSPSRVDYPPPNYGVAATPPPTALRSMRDELLASRARQLESCSEEVYAALAHLPWSERQARVDHVLARIIGADEVYAIEVEDRPSDTEEAERLERILREDGIR